MANKKEKEKGINKKKHENKKNNKGNNGYTKKKLLEKYKKIKRMSSNNKNKDYFQNNSSYDSNSSYRQDDSENENDSDICGFTVVKKKTSGLPNDGIKLSYQDILNGYYLDAFDVNNNSFYSVAESKDSSYNCDDRTTTGTFSQLTSLTSLSFISDNISKSSSINPVKRYIKTSQPNSNSDNNVISNITKSSNDYIKANSSLLPIFNQFSKKENFSLTDIYSKFIKENFNQEQIDNFLNDPDNKKKSNNKENKNLIKDDNNKENTNENNGENENENENTNENSNEKKINKSESKISIVSNPYNVDDEKPYSIMFKIPEKKESSNDVIVKKGTSGFNKKNYQSIYSM